MTKKWWSSYRAIKSQHRETQSCHPYKTPLLASTTKTVRVWTYCENVGHVKTLPIPSTHRQLSHPVETSQQFQGNTKSPVEKLAFYGPNMCCWLLLQASIIDSPVSSAVVIQCPLLCSPLVVVLKWCRNEPPFLLTVVVEVLQ